MTEHTPVTDQAAARPFPYEPGTHVEGTYGEATYTGIIRSYRWSTTQRNCMKITIAVEDDRSLIANGFLNRPDIVVEIDWETGRAYYGYTNHSIRETGCPVSAEELERLNIKTGAA